MCKVPVRLVLTFSTEKVHITRFNIVIIAAQLNSMKLTKNRSRTERLNYVHSTFIISAQGLRKAEPKTKRSREERTLRRIQRRSSSIFVFRSAKQRYLRKTRPFQQSHRKLSDFFFSSSLPDTPRYQWPGKSPRYVVVTLLQLLGPIGALEYVHVFSSRCATTDDRGRQ